MNRTEFIEYYKRGSYPLEVMIGIAPADKLDWKAGDNFWTLGEMLKHISNCPEILIVAIDESWDAYRQRRTAPGPTSMSGEEAVKVFKEKLAITLQRLEKITDTEFDTKQIQTPWGSKGSVGLILQGVMDHQTNHKNQLYMYLKMLGCPVNSGTLSAGKLAEK